MVSSLEHFPEKRKPVFRRKCDEPTSIRRWFSHGNGPAGSMIEFAIVVNA
jgi:hypothetical protein